MIPLPASQSPLIRGSWTQPAQSQVAKSQAKLAVEHKPTRVNNVMNLLRCILRTCVRRKVLKASPADGVRTLREPPADIDPLPLNELNLALAHVQPHFRPLFTCLAWTGARPSELMALRWQDVDFVRAELHINKGKVNGSHLAAFSNQGTPKKIAENKKWSQTWSQTPTTGLLRMPQKPADTEFSGLL